VTSVMAGQGSTSWKAQGSLPIQEAAISAAPAARRGLASTLTPQEIKQLERRSRRENWGRLWYKFSRNPMSVVGLVAVVVLILLAIFAPWVTPYPKHAGPFTDFAHAKLPPGLLAVASVLKPNLWNGMLAVSLMWWPWYARLVYGLAVALSNEYFVSAAEVTGARSGHIIFREMLPNTLSPVLTKMSIDIAWVIIIGSMLSFVGLGVQPPEPSLGTMISDGARYLPDQWWIAVFPALAIVLVVLAFNLMGDGIRDMLASESS
jgi:ABC-type dipeptide/oligopeptide/nickel transport system permease subunit